MAAQAVEKLSTVYYITKRLSDSLCIINKIGCSIGLLISIPGASLSAGRALSTWSGNQPAN